MAEIMQEKPERIIAWGYTIDLYEDSISIFDSNKKLTREGARRIATWINLEKIRMVPFDVNVFQPA